MSFIKTKINNDNSVNLYKYNGDDLQDYYNKDLEKLNSSSDRIRICFLDTETTGLSHAKDKIIEIALKCIEVEKNTGENLIVIVDQHLCTYCDLCIPACPVFALSIEK